MRALAFWHAVTRDHADLLDRVTELLSSSRVSYCVVGGQAVNAYVEPLVSLDLDLAVAAPDLSRIEPLLAPHFKLERFPHSLNLSTVGSDLRIQFQLDPRYGEFPARALRCSVLGKDLPVASLEDVLRGKVWAALDDTRRPSKRQKDLADIARIVEAYPDLRDRVPEELRSRLV